MFFILQLLRPGYVAFEAKVDAEIGFDGLRFEVDQKKYTKEFLSIAHQFKVCTSPTC